MGASFTAGWNQPGYLPDTEPETFATFEEAVGYLKETYERWADEDGSSDTWSSVVIEQTTGSLHAAYRGYVLWVES